MMILRIVCILVIGALPIQGVLNNGGIPAPHYGPPRVPHREYGVPQQIPFREYGPPALKYGPPRLNFNIGQNFQGGFNDQVKAHFGVPKPFYGPPHLQHKPAGIYGPPPQSKPFTAYGPPKPQGVYGPPRPAATFGPPLPQPLPLIQAGPLFKPAGSGFISRPATSYGPPPSGQFIGKPNLNLGPPKPAYGQPPLPNFNRVPETTIIVTSGGGGGGNHGSFGGGGNHGGFGGGLGGELGGIAGLGGQIGGSSVNQVQFQIENQGSGHGGSSNGHFHTASCDGWKPIPAPVGHYVENNNIQTQSGYSSVASGSTGQSLTQYSTGNSVGGLSDEQLVAVALQSGGFETAPTQSLPASGPIDFHSGGGDGSHGSDNQLNSIESEALQISLAAIDDSYSKPPQDSFAPNSAHAQKYNTIGGGGSQSHGLVPPSGAYGPPPTGNGFQTNIIHHSAGSSSFSSQNANLGILYGTQSGNQRPWLGGGSPPSSPVTYRPPVPQGLLESIGATVQHLDQFGVKPPNQPATYIPPPPNEIAEPSAQYGPPQPQLPPPTGQQSINVEFHQQGGSQNHLQQNFQNEQRGNTFNQYLPPPPPPLSVPAPLQQQPLFPPSHQNEHFGGGSNQFDASFGGGQQFVHTQGLPHAHEARFNQPQDCGHGPNLVGANYQLQQSGPLFQQQNFGGTPANTYGPPPSPTGSALDIIAYESKRSSVTSLPDEVTSDNLPGLDSLNVISAQKSHSISIPSQNSQSSSYQIQIQSSGPSAAPTSSEGHTNHEEVLSQGLLQSILTAIEQPQNNHQVTTPQFQSRSDINLNEDADEKEPSSNSIKAVSSDTNPGSSDEGSISATETK